MNETLTTVEMTLQEKQITFTQNIARLIEFAYDSGFALTFGEVYRTVEQQKIYVETGRSKTMNSRHIQRLAVDFNIFVVDEDDGSVVMLFAPGIDNAQYERELAVARPLGDFWESLSPDNVWGADWNRNDLNDEKFRDPYHFEMKP